MRRRQRRFLPVGFRDIAAAAPLGKSPAYRLRRQGAPLYPFQSAKPCCTDATRLFPFRRPNVNFRQKTSKITPPPPRICVRKCNPFNHKGMLTIRAILLTGLLQYNGTVNNCVWPFAVRRPSFPRTQESSNTMQQDFIGKNRNPTAVIPAKAGIQQPKNHRNLSEKTETPPPSFPQKRE